MNFSIWKLGGEVEVYTKVVMGMHLRGGKKDMVCASAKFNRQGRVTVQLLLQQMHITVID